MIRNDPQAQFNFQLALSFGEPDFTVVLSKITHNQYRAWQAFMRCQPFGEIRADLRAAIVARAMAGGELTDHMPLLLEEPDDDLTAVASLYQ